MKSYLPFVMLFAVVSLVGCTTKVVVVAPTPTAQATLSAQQAAYLNTVATIAAQPSPTTAPTNTPAPTMTPVPLRPVVQQVAPPPSTATPIPPPPPPPPPPPAQSGPLLTPQQALQAAYDFLQQQERTSNGPTVIGRVASETLAYPSGASTGKQQCDVQWYGSAGYWIATCTLTSPLLAQPWNFKVIVAEENRPDGVVGRGFCRDYNCT